MGFRGENLELMKCYLRELLEKDNVSEARRLLTKLIVGSWRYEMEVERPENRRSSFYIEIGEFIMNQLNDEQDSKLSTTTIQKRILKRTQDKLTFLKPIPKSGTPFRGYPALRRCHSV